MRRKLFYSLLSPELTSLQKEQIELGKDHDLSDEQISLYASSRYNFAQMREIRLALEHRVDRKKIRCLLDPSLDVSQMAEMRRKLEHGVMPRREGKWLKQTSLFFAGSSALFLTVSLLPAPMGEDSLRLNTDHIIVEEGEVFEPMRNVDGYRAEDGRLVLPDNVDPSVPGTVIAVYRLYRGDRVTRKLVPVTVKKKDTASSETVSGTGIVTGSGSVSHSP